MSSAQCGPRATAQVSAGHLGNVLKMSLLQLFPLVKEGVRAVLSPRALASGQYSLPTLSHEGKILLFHGAELHVVPNTLLAPH